MKPLIFLLIDNDIHICKGESHAAWENDTYRETKYCVQLGDLLASQVFIAEIGDVLFVHSLALVSEVPPLQTHSWCATTWNVAVLKQSVGEGSGLVLWDQPGV